MIFIFRDMREKEREKKYDIYLIKTFKNLYINMSVYMRAHGYISHCYFLYNNLIYYK